MAGFKDIVGQESIKEHMQNAIQMDKVSHAYENHLEWLPQETAAVRAIYMNQLLV